MKNLIEYTRKSLVAWLAVVLMAVVCAAQQPTAGQSTPSDSQAVQSTAEPEHKISKAEAEELFRSVDQILQFVSKDTGLPIKHPVKRKLASREEVQKYIESRMKDDEDRRRLERSAVVLKKFGLLPEKFDLSSFLVQLLKEQVAGFYNSKDKTVYLLDWVEPDAQKPVLAHELTHALQDQNFNLDKWIKAAKGGKTEAERLMEDERMAARQAVSEGQGMVVLLDYMLQPTGQSVKTNPAIADTVMATMAQSGQTPLYTQAPLFLRELLLFPYQHGLSFERDLLVAKGTTGAFAGAFENPPTNTRQVMQPSVYLNGTTLPLMAVPDFEKAAGKDYAKYDLSVMGEFDVWLLMKQYANEKTANEVSKKWRGGYYYAAIRPGSPKPSGKDLSIPKSSLALAYVSKWADAATASKFAAAYAGYLPKLYKTLNPAGNPIQSNAAKTHAPAQSVTGEAEAFTGTMYWETDEGPVLIETKGDTVLVLEGFDRAASQRLRKATLNGKDND